MRRPRIKAEGAGYYHCMSRAIERRHIQDIFRRYRGHFGATRQSGPRLMRYANWGELRTMRDLRLDVVCRY